MFRDERSVSVLAIARFVLTDILFRLLVERDLASLRAEIVRLPLVFALRCCLFFIDVHTAYDIFCHFRFSFLLNNNLYLFGFPINEKGHTDSAAISPKLQHIRSASASGSMTQRQAGSI